jgi:hypothetical protein
VAFLFHKLAKDIESGLETALKDGIFSNYLYHSREVKDVLERADLPNGRTFHIANPFYPNQLRRTARNSALPLMI